MKEYEKVKRCAKLASRYELMQLKTVYTAFFILGFTRQRTDECPVTKAKHKLRTKTKLWLAG